MRWLKIVENTDWHLEIGALAALSFKHKENTPVLLFDRIKDSLAGYRIFVGFFESLRTTNVECQQSLTKKWKKELLT